MDRAAFLLADAYPKLEAALAKIRKAKKDALAAEEDRVLDFQEELKALSEEENKALIELGKSGQARLAIDQALPADIRQGCDAARSELAPHLEALESAERQLKHQKEHAAKAKKDLDPKHPGDKFDLEGLDKATAQAENRVKVEKERCTALQAKLQRFEGLREAFFKTAREEALTPKAAAKAHVKEKEPHASSEK